MLIKETHTYIQVARVPRLINQGGGSRRRRRWREWMCLEPRWLRRTLKVGGSEEEEEEVEEEVEVGGWRYDTVPWWSFFW